MHSRYSNFHWIVEQYIYCSRKYFHQVMENIWYFNWWRYFLEQKIYCSTTQWKLYNISSLPVLPPFFLRYIYFQTHRHKQIKRNKWWHDRCLIWTIQLRGTNCMFQALSSGTVYLLFQQKSSSGLGKYIIFPPPFPTMFFSIYLFSNTHTHTQEQMTAWPMPHMNNIIKKRLHIPLSSLIFLICIHFSQRWRGRNKWYNQCLIWTI